MDVVGENNSLTGDRVEQTYATRICRIRSRNTTNAAVLLQLALAHLEQCRERLVTQPADAKVHGDLLSFSMALWRTGVRVPTRFPKTRVDENPECACLKEGTVGRSKHVGLHEERGSLR